MKRVTILSIVVLLMFSNADAQGILNKIKSKAKQRADKKVDNEIDKKLDEAEGKGKKNKDKKEETGGNAVVSTVEAPAQPSVKSFSKFDFIPGDSILYYENFEGEQLAELPVNWNTSGTGEVVTLEKYSGNWLRLHKRIAYLADNTKVFGENYTMEFDMILQLKNNGWMYPEIRFGLFSTMDEPTTDNSFLKEEGWIKNAAIVAKIIPGEFKTTKIMLNSYKEKRAYFKGDPKSHEVLEKKYGTPVHVSIQVQKERFRMWIVEEKVFDVPKGIPAGTMMNQLLFEVGHTNYAEEQYGIYLTNIKVATGRPDTRHKLIEEGKFSTTGILFDFQSAVIKPESYAVVKEIAGVLKENGKVRIKVLGHTSSDGDDKANMELSKKRAAAVKDLMVSEFGIDAGRIETEGMGETRPVADNKTTEGKMQNRRVEFVKL